MRWAIVRVKACQHISDVASNVTLGMVAYCVPLLQAQDHQILVHPGWPVVVAYAHCLFTDQCRLSKPRMLSRSLMQIEDCRSLQRQLTLVDCVEISLASHCMAKGQRSSMSSVALHSHALMHSSPLYYHSKHMLFACMEAFQHQQHSYRKASVHLTLALCVLISYLA